MATPPICSFNQFGYCKYKEECRKHHIDDICSDSSCDFLTCKLRHPRLCNWYSEYGRCKFNPCKFKHEEKDETMKTIVRENQEVMSKLEEVEKSLIELRERENETTENIERLEKCVKDTEKRLTDMENTAEKKLQSMENRISTLTQCMEEKDSTIENLTNKLQNMSERFEKVERRVYILEKTKLGNDFCDFCGDEFEKKSVMNAHIRFIHTFECEICDIRFKTLTELETHMHTCEKFDCERCKMILKTVSDTKNHCKSKHKNGGDIFHYKFDRENPRKVTIKHIRSTDL